MVRTSHLKAVETASRSPPKEQPHRELPIKSIFYSEGGKEVLKRNSSSIPLNGIAAAIKHLRRNTYQAWVVEIYDMRNAKLHSVMKRRIDGRIEVLFERKHEKEGE